MIAKWPMQIHTLVGMEGSWQRLIGSVLKRYSLCPDLKMDVCDSHKYSALLLELADLTYGRYQHEI